MRRLAFSLALVLAACAAPGTGVAVAPEQSASPTQTALASSKSHLDVDPMVDTCRDGSPMPTGLHSPMRDANGCPYPTMQPPQPQPVGPAQPYTPPAQVPQPTVTLRTASFPTALAPSLRRINADLLNTQLGAFGIGDLMAWLDHARGGGPYGASVATDEEWNSRFWPGPFQRVAKAVVAARPAPGRFFNLDAWHVDAAYALPWSSSAASTPEELAKAVQFVDVTLEFRDHAETPPAHGELWYTWHVRFPTSGLRVFAVADGYDGVSAKSWMNTGPAYWSRASLEQEATSAVASYLWNESYVPGGYPQTTQRQWNTPFAEKRVGGIEHLNELFNAQRLTERRFENASVRIDRFEPMTFFGGGVVTVTVSGRLVEVLDGKTITENFAQPMKFFRFGGSGIGINGWTPVDSQEDGVWLSGGDLALGELFVSHG